MMANVGGNTFTILSKVDKSCLENNPFREEKLQINIRYCVCIHCMCKYACVHLASQCMLPLLGCAVIGQGQGKQGQSDGEEQVKWAPMLH